MWKNLMEWFGALLITASMAVSVLGAAEWLEKRNSVIPVVSAQRAGVVVVDAGHGGADGGAVGSKTGVQEAGLNLAVATRVKEILEEKGVQVVMTRTDANALDDDKQKDMQMRKQIFSEGNVRLVVSIHMNAFPDRDISGAMAYYMAGSEEGQKLAQKVIDSVCDATQHARRLANPGDYFVLRECACPAVLVECGFLSNAEEEARLQEIAYQEKLALSIATGVYEYMEKHDVI